MMHRGGLRDHFQITPRTIRRICLVLGCTPLRSPAHGTALPVFARSHAYRCLLRTWRHVRTREPCFEALQRPHGWSASMTSEILGKRSGCVQATALSRRKDETFFREHEAPLTIQIPDGCGDHPAELAGMAVRCRPRGAETLATPRFGRF